MKNYFGITQRHIQTHSVYGYHAKRRNRNGIRNPRRTLKIPYAHKRGTMIKNTKYLNNKNWGKMAIGVHTKNVL